MAKVIDSISSYFNSATTATVQTVNKVMTNPSTVKKVLQIANKTFAAIDLYNDGVVHKRGITEAMKGTTDLIEFYGTFKNLVFWINPFSKETLDQETLLESLKISLCASHQTGRQIKKQEKFAQSVFDEVMSEQCYHSKGEVLDAIRVSLEKRGYQPLKAEQLAEKVIIQQKSRSIILLFSMACFTLADLGGNLLTLKKWNVLDLTTLGGIALKIGGQSRVLLFVVNLGLDTVLGTIASAGLVVVVGEAAYRTVMTAIKRYHAATPTEKDQAYQELRHALLDLAAGGTDLIYTALPLFVVLNPPVVIGLALLAKGTGLICVLIR